MLLEDSDGPYLYMPSEGPQPRAAFTCRMVERCTDSTSLFPTYILEACEAPDSLLGCQFAVTVPYSPEGLRSPDSFIPVHAYRDLLQILGERTPGELVVERGNLLAVP